MGSGWIIVLSLEELPAMRWTVAKISREGVGGAGTTRPHHLEIRVGVSGRGNSMYKGQRQKRKYHLV